MDNKLKGVQQTPDVLQCLRQEQIQDEGTGLKNNCKSIRKGERLLHGNGFSVDRVDVELVGSFLERCLFKG